MGQLVRVETGVNKNDHQHHLAFFPDGSIVFCQKLYFLTDKTLIITVTLPVRLNTPIFLYYCTERMSTNTRWFLSTLVPVSTLLSYSYSLY